MKLLCFSDSHGTESAMLRALKLHPDAEAVFFLGDGLSDAEHSASSDFLGTVRRPWFAVRGNCDFSSTFLGEEIHKVDSVCFDGVKILFTHGDLFGVKYSADSLIALGKEKEADIVLFGHTHTAFEYYVNNSSRPLYLFNPGSISCEGSPSFSYGIITLQNGSILLSHGTVSIWR